jgi:hypothetical protein
VRALGRNKPEFSSSSTRGDQEGEPSYFFRVNDPVIDELTTKLRQTPDRAEQRAITKKIVDREYDQVLRMRMPYDNGFLAGPLAPPGRETSRCALSSVRRLIPGVVEDAARMAPGVRPLLQ